MPRDPAAPARVPQPVDAGASASYVRRSRQRRLTPMETGEVEKGPMRRRRSDRAELSIR